MNSNKDRLYFFWSAAIFLCLFLVVFSIIFVSCKGVSASDTSPETNSPIESPSPDKKSKKKDKKQDDAEPEQSPDSSQEPEQQEGQEQEEQEEQENASAQSNPSDPWLFETQDMGQEYIDKITFLGDSTTYGLAYYGILSGGNATDQVWVPESGTLSLHLQSSAAIVYPETGEDISIVDAALRKQPEMMVITLGVNGVSMMGEEYFKSEYISLISSIKSVSPGTKLILNSIYPVADSYKDKYSVSNEKIDSANTWIQQIAADSGAKYLDSCSVLKDESGRLYEHLHNGDGIHLNAEGYNMVLNYIRTHGYEEVVVEVEGDQEQ